MAENLLIGLSSIIVLGIGAQWLAWLLKIPAILILLVAGFVAGPVTGFLEPDLLMGPILFPIISVSVAIILFDGGLSLSVSDLPKVGGVVRNLISVGALVTFLITAAAAHYVFGLPWSLGWLLGAILIVTGPTVIIPMLRDIKPLGQVGPILRWEGIVIDPIGAMFAVLVFEVIVTTEASQAPTLVLVGIVRTLLVGGGIGLLAAGLLILLLKRYWIPDFLDNAVTLTFVVVAFTASNLIQHESGLLTVTVMGIILANQPLVAVRHIIEFKEHLRVVLLSGLFVILAARLELEQMLSILGPGLIFLLIVVVLARPAGVLLSAIGSSLEWRERLFLSWMAPRGVVAAAVSSVFALRLSETGMAEAELLVPVTFMVIIGTIAVYALTTPILARLVGLSHPDPQGALIAGAHSWACALGATLQKEGFRVVMVDTNLAHINMARRMGIRSAVQGSILSEQIEDELNLTGVGRLLALTPNDEVNSLAALHLAHLFGRAQVYQLPPAANGENEREAVSKDLRGRYLFDPLLTYQRLDDLFSQGARLEVIEWREGMSWPMDRNEGVPLFLIPRPGELTVYTLQERLLPKPGQRLIVLKR